MQRKRPRRPPPHRPSNRPDQRASHRPPQRPATREQGEELRISGLRAVEALFRRDPDAILRLYLDRPMAQKAGAICHYLAERRRGYAIKDAVELAKIAGTQHHGGIVAVRAERAPRVPAAAEIDAWAGERLPVLVMDGVGNPHNFGAILRSAAFLGVETVVLSERKEQALPSPAAYRVAEGGLEFVALWRPASLPAFCRDLARRYRVIGAAARGTPLDALKPSDPRNPNALPVALVLGNEETGLSPPVAKACSELVAIPGHADRVDSLNDSVAAGILIHALLRR